MRPVLLPLLLLSFLVHGQPPPGYYDPASGLTGQALRQVLGVIISGHTVLPNNALWEAFALTDARTDGSVWDMYSDIPEGTSAYGYEFVTDQCGTYSGEGDCFNREHSFPQSWYSSAAPMSTDLFHIYPADAWVNQQRGNLAYGRVGSTNWTSTNGSKRGDCNWPGCSGSVFEPIDAYKGDFARSFFYMHTRYLPQLNTWDCPMMENGEFSPWAESLLLSWHAQDPVSAKETDRNNMVQLLQGNRNPYIDEPQWVPAIWGPTASVSAPVEDHPVRSWFHAGTISVELTEKGAEAMLVLYDTAGRRMKDATLQGPRAHVEVDLPPGLYVAVVHVGSARNVLRFVH